jgi:twinkle protein
MAVNQCTGLPAVSLPNGCRSLPLEILPLLEKMEKIYLWMDDDVPGQEGVEKFVEKLGVNRCLIVRPPAGSGVKDANEMLMKGLKMRPCIDAAKPVPHKQILTFTELKNDILMELSNPLQVAGVQSQTLPGLNRLLKGHRKGELTILTGATGAGKTTLLSQVGLFHINFPIFCRSFFNAFVSLPPSFPHQSYPLISLVKESTHCGGASR